MTQQIHELRYYDRRVLLALQNLKERGHSVYRIGAYDIKVEAYPPFVQTMFTKCDLVSMSKFMVIDYITPGDYTIHGHIKTKHLADVQALVSEVKR